MLAKLKDQWKGTIVFVGQPAEEIGIGARAMLKDGLYTRWPKPDFALGLHDSAGLRLARSRSPKATPTRMWIQWT